MKRISNDTPPRRFVKANLDAGTGVVLLTVFAKLTAGVIKTLMDPAT